MRLSRYFMPTLREAPADAQIVSHKLMLRAGMIRQEAAGIYAWLPLGLKVLKKIEQVVREEMNRAGAVEILMPTLQLADLWRRQAPLGWDVSDPVPVARAICWLLSDYSQGISGEIVHVDGGFHAVGAPAEPVESA